MFRAGDLTVDLVRRVVTVRGKQIKFSPREYDLLRVLVAHAGKVLTHNTILQQVWESDSSVQYLRIYIRALRQKIERKLKICMATVSWPGPSSPTVWAIYSTAEASSSGRRSIRLARVHCEVLGCRPQRECWEESQPPYDNNRTDHQAHELHTICGQSAS